MVQSGYEDKKRALRIARTELMKTAHDVSLKNYRKNGVEEVIWVSGETAHTCAVCWAMSGRRFKINEVPYDHPNGRCQLSPYLPELEEFNPEAYNHDTEAEFNRLTEDEQKNILGIEGKKLHDLYKVSLSDFSEYVFNEENGLSIKTPNLETIITKAQKNRLPELRKKSVRRLDNQF